MMKKILLLLAIVLPSVLRAQYAEGDWRVHPYYVGDKFNNVIDTDTKVYYLVGSDLFCFDKATQQTESLSKRNVLNDGLIANIYYNHHKKYVLVTYVNSDIDIIGADGTVTNLPDIKDVVLPAGKAINHVSFTADNIYVATEFGMVVYDGNTLGVVEARIFNYSFSSATEVGNWVLFSTYGNVYAALKTSSREYFSNYTALSGISGATNAHVIAVNSTQFIVNASNGVKLYTLGTGSDNKPSIQSSQTISSKRASIIQRTPSGFLCSFPADGYSITLDHNGGNAQQVSSGAELLSSCPSGNGTVWALNATGLHQQGSQQYYRVNGIGIKVGAFYMVYNQALNKVFLSSSSDNSFAEWGSDHHAVTQIFTYDGHQWVDETPGSLPGNGASSNWQLAMDPLDANTYVYPSRKYGVFKITNGKLVTQYGSSNSYFADNYYKGACAFDSQGNLWVVYSSPVASAGTTNVAVLPRAKYEQATCSKSDWILVDVPATRQKSFKGSNFVIANDVKVYNAGGYQNSFVFWKQNALTGTPTIANYSSLQDEDGKSITWINNVCMATDNNGMVWAGLNNGVVAFDPTKAFDETFVVDHLKMPRNDGTDLYDYLLDGVKVNTIAVDAANRKWIGTNDAGLYLVSPDGSKILRHFTTDNSYLTTNTIYSVCCNTTTNSVYVLTALGFLEFMSDASPAAQNYDDVYVYPNPVRPDFTGLLTIKNLMNNSHVKITNVDGNVVKQMQSNGGLATWDCCDSEGARVATGLYYVYASQTANDSGAKKVAEFLVIK